MNSILQEILGIGDQCDKNRVFLIGLFKTFGYTLEHAEPGDYDSGRNGFLVFKHPDQKDFVRVDLQEDSYSGGYYGGYTYVQPKQKTITVWE